VKPLDDSQKHTTRSGGTLTILGPRDRLNRCRFTIEWEDSVAHCSKCGVRVGEGWPVRAEDGPTCTANPGSRGVCGGKMTKRRGQVFFAEPENYVDLPG